MKYLAAKKKLMIQHPMAPMKVIRDARAKPYDFVAIGQDDMAHLAIEASEIRRCGNDLSPSLYAAYLEGAIKAVARSNRAARFHSRRAEMLTKRRRASA